MVVAVGVAAPSVIVKTGLVEARYWVVSGTHPERPDPVILSISMQLTSPPDGFAVHCTVTFSTTTSPPIVKVCIPSWL